MGRLRELDFLRGVAILLVLVRHIPLISYLTNMGWIGVDLFFVLSGFLVSSLLFKEYIKFGNIQPKLFLIRRGFKIYPIYFIFYLLYLIPIIFLNHNFNLIGFLSDMTFTQNYIWGWGYAYVPSWSLAIEEHFYFGFAFLVWAGLKYNKINLKTEKNLQPFKKRFEIIVFSLLVTVFLLRLLSNNFFLQQDIRNFTMTHLRIDSLLFGTLISYFYYFKNEYLKNLFHSNQNLLYVVCILGLIWTPFIDPLPSFFVRTIGFSLLYISFGILLIIFLFKSNINQFLNRIFSTKLVNVISKIGYCSYSIYIIHTFFIIWYEFIIKHWNLYSNKYMFFLIASTLSVITGMIMTYKVEKYFLSVRDKYFPSRV